MRETSVDTVSFEVTSPLWKSNLSQDRVIQTARSTVECVHRRLQTLILKVCLARMYRQKNALLDVMKKRSQNCGQPVAGVWYVLGKMFFLKQKTHVSIFKSVPAGVWYSIAVARASSWSEQHASGKPKKSDQQQTIIQVSHWNLLAHR